MRSGFYLESDKMKIERLVVGPLAANCYIIRLDSLDLIIDPGAEPEVIINYLDLEGFKPDMIINTHGHYDHDTHKGYSYQGRYAGDSMGL